MERITASLRSRAVQLARDRPEADIRPVEVEGTWYAWKPEPGDPFSGELTHGRTEAELLAKLGAAVR